MKKYTPVAPIPERGNVLCIPFDTVASMAFMNDDRRLAMFDSMAKWFLELDGEMPMLSGLHRTMFEQWQAAQMRFAQSAREKQANARAAANKKHGKNHPPPPVR